MDAETKATLADVYERAAEYLEEYGWAQDMGFHGEPRCFMGAIESIVGMGDNYYTTAVLACEALGLTFHWNAPTAVGCWNDTPGRTKDEVINTLHALANKLR